MDRRKFLKLMGGIAALPAVGSLGSGAKKAKKGIVAAGQAAKMTPTQSILPDVVATVMKKGKEFDTGMPTSSTVGKEYKGVKVTESPDEIFVEFTTDSGNGAFASIKKADYVVDETTGKSVYKPPEYEEGQQVYRAFSKDDYVKDVEFEVLDDVSGLQKIAMEGKVSEQVKDIAGRLKKREGKSGGGAVGQPPVYETNSPSEAAKEIISRVPFLGGSGEVIPIYDNQNTNIEAYLGSPQDNVRYGLGAFTSRGDLFLNELNNGNRQIGAEFGTTATPNTTFAIGYTEGQGPQFGLQYQRRFADGGRAEFFGGGFARGVKLAENQGMIKKAESKSTKKPLTKKLREPIIKQLRSANVISENDISRILEKYGILSLAEGGVASGPPPEKGPNSQGLESLFQTR